LLSYDLQEKAVTQRLADESKRLNSVLKTITHGSPKHLSTIYVGFKLV